MAHLFQTISLAGKGREPLYLRLAMAIRECIQAGQLQAGERLPAVREAAQLLGVNVNTAHRAYNLLARESVLISRRGAGTTVAQPRPPSSGPAHPQAAWLSARNQLEGTVRAIEVSGVMAEVVLELPGGQQVVAAITRTSVERLGLAVGEPALAIVKSTDVMIARAPAGE